MTSHVPDAVLDRYAAGESGAADAWWAVEAHLEGCAACRARLAAGIGPDTAALLERVRADLAGRTARTARMPARRRLLPQRWAAPATLPRLGMTALVVLAAVGLDLADGTGGAGRYPSLVLLLAPVAPLLAVAASWSRGLDPAYEIVVASARAGLDLVLRRTLAVLAVVIPTLGAAGWVAGASPARWLLPCLACTAGALALGDVVGLHRAATGLAVAWVAVVAGPSLALDRVPVLLDPASLPGWAGLTAAVAVVLVLRRRSYTALPSAR